MGATWEICFSGKADSPLARENFVFVFFSSGAILKLKTFKRGTHASIKARDAPKLEL